MGNLGKLDLESIKEELRQEVRRQEIEENKENERKKVEDSFKKLIGKKIEF